METPNGCAFLEPTPCLVVFKGQKKGDTRHFCMRNKKENHKNKGDVFFFFFYEETPLKKKGRRPSSHRKTPVSSHPRQGLWQEGNDVEGTADHLPAVRFADCPFDLVGSIGRFGFYLPCK